MSNGMPDAPWDVSYIDRVNLFARLLVLDARALRRGIRGAYQDALRIIEEQLLQNPLGWGDPVYEAKQAGYTRRHGSQPPLHAYYAVHEESRCVWVQDILAVPGWGLDED